MHITIKNADTDWLLHVPKNLGFIALVFLGAGALTGVYAFMEFAIGLIGASILLAIPAFIQP